MGVIWVLSGCYLGVIWALSGPMKDKAAQQLKVQAARQPKETYLGSRSCQAAQDYMAAKQPKDSERALSSPLMG
eukprot:11215907-Lingulodinium_polyedra.AAC.1